MSPEWTRRIWRRRPDLDRGWRLLQLYFSWSQIFGNYENPSEVRASENWYFMKDRGLRVNAEFIHVNKSPVGYTAYPLPVGGNGNVIHLNFEMNF